MSAPTDLVLGDLLIKIENREVYRNDKRIPLRKKEYDLFEFLARNQERVINRFTILEYVWNYNAHINTNTLEVHMAALRRKIEGHCKQKIIHTIHGIGYKLSFADL